MYVKSYLTAYVISLHIEFIIIPPRVTIYV